MQGNIKTVAILGSSGFLGKALINSLKPKGYRIVRLTREISDENKVEKFLGSLNIDVFIENNLTTTIKFLKSIGFWVVGLENSIEAQRWYEIDYKGKIVIVLGSEGTGIRKLVRESCDFLATIPMEGKTNSLNVSAALSAILFERHRQILQIK